MVCAEREEPEAVCVVAVKRECMCVQVEKVVCGELAEYLQVGSWERLL